MKKPVLIGGVIVVAAVVIVAIVAMGGKDNKTSSSETSKTATTSKKRGESKKACDVLTAAIAQAVVGPDAATSDEASTGASSDDITVSNCAYYSLSTKTSVGLLVRAPKTDTGAKSNKQQFKSGLPSDAQKVTGYGEAAYWSPQYGQLNILKNDTWYILSAGPVRPTEHTLDGNKAYADKIISQL